MQRAYLIPDVVGGFDFRVMAREMQAEFPGLKHVLVAGEPAPGQLALAALPDAPAPVNGPRPADVSTMLLSGGTTSLSKLIPRTHDDYVLNARLCGAAAGFTDRTVFMAILPLGHNYNLASPGMLGAFYFGGTVVIAPGTGVDEVFSLVQRERVTVIAAVVPLITTWLNSEALSAYDLSSLAVVQNGGARLAPELRRRLRQQLHCTPQEIYGTAEGLINMTRLGDPDELLLESSGAPVCDEDEIMVIDDAGSEVADGEAGELVTRGPYTIRAYYNAPGKNAEAFLPGRLVPDGRRRSTSRPLRLYRGPAQGHDQPRRRKDQLRGDRETSFSHTRASSPPCWSACPTPSSARKPVRASSHCPAKRSPSTS